MECDLGKEAVFRGRRKEGAKRTEGENTYNNDRIVFWTVLEV